MRERAESIARGETAWVPPPVRDAATVCLLRDGSSGLEVFLMRRTTSMAFAAGMYVYPGGAVERSDSRVPVAGRADLAVVGARTWSPDPRALLVAAARETFEECGVLLAVDDRGAPAPVDAGLEDDRVALVDGVRSFAEILSRRGLLVDDAALVPFAHWVTPEVEDRRYDTRFFAAAQPAAQEARHVEGEADRSSWWRPADALSASAEGRMALLPPTAATLAVLAQHIDAASALAAAVVAQVEPILPAPRLDADGSVSWHLLHDRTREVLGTGREPAASETDGVAPRGSAS
ncbi:MAG TPA: NUDIX hydrolase [Candidatus Angelobacter sp.]|nr:NUDIX hydrolase [Candidatus Angelobacter sp.]